MIKDIEELNFPEYATMRQATVRLEDMGDKTITSTIRMDGEIAPDFSYDWAVAFGGDKYIMPLRKPEAGKENTELCSTATLTFEHWAIYWLKKWFFFEYASVGTGTAIANKWIVGLSLNLKGFTDYFAKVLQYWFGDTITIDLNPAWNYKAEPTMVNISYSCCWDVLRQYRELWGVRWEIKPRSDNSNTVKGGERYVIRVGYPATELSHLFEYGFEGGLLKLKREVQDEKICNVMLGRGGEKNLPLRYFKDTDPNNKDFPADPDWVKELANIYFTNLLPATFRSYIQGWKAAHISEYPGYTAVGESNAYAPWAYHKGLTDEKFDPVEYVKDDESIAEYGEQWDGLENNDEIFPTIQGITVTPYGRVDEAVAVEQVLTDDVENAAETVAITRYTPIARAKGSVTLAPQGRANVEVCSDWFEVLPGEVGNLDAGEVTKIVFRSEEWRPGTASGLRPAPQDVYDKVEVGIPTLTVYDSQGVSHSAVGLLPGRYYFKASIPVYYSAASSVGMPVLVTVALDNARLQSGDTTSVSEWKQTFNVWVKNIWQTQQLSTETPAQYAERVWKPILGDRTGDKAKLMFTTGNLTNEDYKFTIVEFPAYDTTKKIAVRDAQGNPTGQYYDSHWRLKLAKSEAELEATGLYVPSTERQGNAGDHIVFIGTEMTHWYTLQAEKRVDDAKKDVLLERKSEGSNWVVTPDKVRLDEEGAENALLRQLSIGASVRIADKRFITMKNAAGEIIPSSAETRYIQSLTYTYNEDSIIPDVGMSLGNDYMTAADPVARISGEVSALQRQVGSISNIEQIVRMVGDKLYLRKDGIEERSYSPTEFVSLVTSQGFRAGSVGGAGWGFYKDANGSAVLEADILRARKGIEANELVINQISVQGGKYVESAAWIEVSNVVEDTDSYTCYFDQKGGSVVNRFHVDDVAYSEVTDDATGQVKHYRRRVMSVGTDNIVLTKGYTAVQLPDGTYDTGVDGGGKPSVGDVIAHYGNYTDANRRFVKVRDVIGGGYERYIEGLDSVNSSGTEYYYVGRQAGLYYNKPRFFLGGDASYIEWVNGNLRVKGRIDAESTIGDVPIGEYVSDSIKIGGTNLILGGGAEKVNVRGTSYEIAQGTVPAIIKGNEYILTVRKHPDHGDLSEGMRVYLWDQNDEQIVFLGNMVIAADGRTATMSFTYDNEVSPAKVRISKARGSFTYLNAKLEAGNVSTAWSPAPQEATDASTEYLKKALENDTTIEGGLIVTSNIQTGYKDESGKFVTMAGVNGITPQTARGGGIALWSGGKQIDAADNQTEGAAFAVRMDGTGYFAHNTVRIGQSSLELGDNVKVTKGRFVLENPQTKGTVFQLQNSRISFTTQVGALDRELSDTVIMTGAVNHYSPSAQEEWRSPQLSSDYYSIGYIPKNGLLAGYISVSFEFQCQQSDNEGTKQAKNSEFEIEMYALDSDGSLIPVAAFEGSDNVTAWTKELIKTENGIETWRATRKRGIEYGNESQSFSAFYIRVFLTPTSTQTVSFRRENVPITMKLDLAVENVSAEQTVVGNNGIAVSFGNTLLVANDDGVAMVFGNKYISITERGIKINRGNGEVDL
jgi:hypothetical protein